MNPSVELPDWVSLSILPPDRVTKRCKRADVVHGMQQLSLEHQFLPSFLFEHRKEDVHTCLIRILSVGNEQDDAQQQEWIHRQVRHILASSKNRHFATNTLRRTTPLHVALRNYGSFRALLQTLIEADPAMLSQSDDTGEYPIHTACRIGIPLENLQLLLSHMTSNASLGSPNHRGWTAFDLAWIRYLEIDDIGTLLQRHDIGGNSIANQRLSRLFANLLTETINHILQSEHRDSAMTAVAPLLKVISCLLQASVTNPDDRSEESQQYLIHQAFQAVSCWDGLPLLPLPIIKLMFVQYQHQIEWADHNGKLPLHYAVSIRPRPTKQVRSIPQADLRLYVREVLNQNPHACLVKDAVGRLPIHYCLDNRHNDTCESFYLIVKDVLLACPVAIEIVDPVSCLYPFMMAATDSNLSLELVYMMLRFHPQCLPSSVH
ncbi:hypothetical protein FisN_32Hh061 [Fistulifera solaris]|uniref:Uncharacterized protein n=1 Tax=Fistulifera solaris TaxID=1519565 RepID=A0A1Z5K3B8_FISSO|nr:hypothetical protein FisN_32Hh061 [Fistulifera solaris]|eukprot:GAX20672.1 hypothetical protein FisN_32Hh061 [Fistulifera solaris]